MHSRLIAAHPVFFVFILLFSIHSIAFGQVIEAWVAHYDSPYGGPYSDDHDGGENIEIDALGNIYVTGDSPGRWWYSTSEDDILTIKYDPQGNELWVARYGDVGFDHAGAFALDRDSNVYVTGMTETSDAFDYVTIKYDAEGNELWSSLWGGGDIDESYGIAVDKFGNSYVTGFTQSLGPNADYLTIKYDTNGNEEWVARYDAGGYDSPAGDIAVDTQGNVYVTGKCIAWGRTGYDWVTIKYDNDGHELWIAEYDGPVGGLDEPVAIAINSSGDVLVTGRAESNDNDVNYTTIKYDRDGSELWVVLYGEGSHGNMPNAMVIDAASNVYVTGWSDKGTTDDDYATVKYDSDGNELWVARYDGAGYRDQPFDIAVDIDGGVVVTGWSTFGDIYTSRDIVTIKYDLNGNELWNQRYDAADRDDGAAAIALDTQGNVCVTGYSDINFTNQFTTIKYMPTVSLGLTGVTPIVTQGGTLRYQVGVTNNTPEPQTIWAWIKEKLPTGEWAEGYHVPPTNLILDPDHEGTYSLHEIVPLSALLGPHEYWGYIGADTSAVWDCDMFPFSVYFQRHEHQSKEK